MINGDKHKKLLVEGNDDEHVVLALRKKFEIKENFDIVNCGSIDKLLIEIPTRLKESDIETLGIIVDADSNLVARYNELKRIFEKANIKLPENLHQNGLIINKDDVIINSTGKLTIGIWIMPNNNLNGMIEDFITFLIPNEDELLPIIKQNLETIENKQLNKYKEIHKSKAIIHSWLAIQETPGTPMGHSITRKYLTTEKEICSIFIDWLGELFGKKL